MANEEAEERIKYLQKRIAELDREVSAADKSARAHSENAADFAASVISYDNPSWSGRYIRSSLGECAREEELQAERYQDSLSRLHRERESLVKELGVARGEK